MAFNRIIREFEAATAAEQMSAAVEAGFADSPAVGSDSSLGTFLNPLDISPAFALIDANSALTDANVSTTTLSSTSEFSIEREAADRSRVTLPQSILPSLSTAPDNCSDKDRLGSKSNTRASFPSTSKTRFTHDGGTFAFIILKYLLQGYK
jgi:hypothetical protein